MYCNGSTVKDCEIKHMVEFFMNKKQIKLDNRIRHLNRVKTPKKKKNCKEIETITRIKDGCALNWSIGQSLVK